MLFNPHKKSTKLVDKLSAKKQCVVCPLKKYKGCDPAIPDNVDILLLTEKTKFEPLQNVLGYPTMHSYMVECATLGSDPPVQAKTCCAGRKIDMIELTKPKMVICAGYEPFKTVETACDNFPEGRCEDFFYPTRYKDHDFWLLQVPDYDIINNINGLADRIHEMMTQPPAVQRGNLDGIEFVVDNDDIDPAFDWLEQQEYLGIDIETVGFRPYKADNVILSVAIGTKDRVYAFPMFHPQTPSNFDIMKVILRLRRMTKPRLIAHNAPFEMENLSQLMETLGLEGSKWLFEVGWEDTQAQAYLINSPNRYSKKLNACVRRAFGFDLKSMSNIDVENLINTPIEQVLSYNALDSKYTHAVFFEQREVIELLELQENYARQILEGITAVVMQRTGLLPNHEFVAKEITVWRPLVSAAIEEFNQYPQVRESISKYGQCNPASDKDLERLFREEFNTVSDSFDDNFLTNFHHPISQTLKNFRKPSKIISTYLHPFAINEPDGGKYIWEDGLIHVQFNTMHTKTGRWSSNEPNGQNYPSRDGKKYLRNSIQAPPDHVMIAIDMAQIEYRVAASLTNDPVMIDGLFNDFDVHMYWALEVLKLFPHLVDDHKDKKKLKAFRSAMKSAVVFALIYGAGANRIAESLKVTDMRKVYRLIEMFWEKHGAIKKWQNERKEDHNVRGVIYNAFGRPYFAPMTHNQICNFPIQGTASDCLINAAGKLIKKQVMEEAPWQLVLNIHDDLTFYIHKDKVDDALCEIIPTMLNTRGYESWLKVPLGVEVSIGTQWGDMTPLGDFFSHQIAA